MRDHGGGIDAAATRFGRTGADRPDMATEIDPEPALPAKAWPALQDATAMQALTCAARTAWAVPDGAAVLAHLGASAQILHIPTRAPSADTKVRGPTCHENAFTVLRRQIRQTSAATAPMVVHPITPDGRGQHAVKLQRAPFTVNDENFSDVKPEAPLVPLADRPGAIVLKSFGKFWRQAGLRLGFAIGDPAPVARLERLA